MTWHVKCQVGVAYRYNDLAKVSAVETIQNELVVSKWDEKSFHFGPRKSAWHCKSPCKSPLVTGATMNVSGRTTLPDKPQQCANPPDCK